MKLEEPSVNTVTLISYRHRLVKLQVLLGGKGTKGGGGRVRLSNVDTGRLTGFKYKLICCFKLVTDMVGVTSRNL